LRIETIVGVIAFAIFAINKRPAASKHQDRGVWRLYKIKNSPFGKGFAM
jgi:hypothetical protein